MQSLEISFCFRLQRECFFLRQNHRGFLNRRRTDSTTRVLAFTCHLPVQLSGFRGLKMMKFLVPLPKSIQTLLGKALACVAGIVRCTEKLLVLGIAGYVSCWGCAGGHWWTFLFHISVSLSLCLSLALSLSKSIQSLKNKKKYWVRQNFILCVQ